MFLSIRRIGVVCVFLSVFGTTLRAATSEAAAPAAQITLAQAIDLALRRNPELIASGYGISAAQARVLQAAVRPNPDLGLELENFAGSGSLRGTDALETTLSLSQVVELGGKRQLRVAVAEGDLDVVSIEQRARQLDVLADVTRRFIDVVAAQERWRFAEQSSQLAQKTLEAIATRVDAARSPEAERSRARIAVTRSQLEQAQARSELQSARYTLAALWGDAQPTFSAAQANLFAFRALGNFESLLAQLERNPDFVRFASEARLRDAELRLAQAQARPNVTFSLGVRRFEENDDAALVGGFSMALPVFDRNRGAIREAQVRRAQSEAERSAAFARTRAGLFGLYQEVSAARVRSDTLRSEAIPQAQTALEQTQYGYERGRFSFLELVTAQQELLGLQEAAIDAAADHHRLLAEIERLTSQPLTDAALESQVP